MRCPSCGSIELKVVSTTPNPADGEIRRRRECLDCGSRFTTIERIRSTLPLVIKSGGQQGMPVRVQQFDRAKLRRGIEIACAKRPIPPSAVERLVDQVEFQLSNSGRDEVPSRLIGEMVLEGLKELDEVAYLRYAIIFLELGDLVDVKREVEGLLKTHRDTSFKEE